MTIWFCMDCKKEIPEGSKCWLGNHLTENPDCPDYVLCDECYIKGEQNDIEN